MTWVHDVRARQPGHGVGHAVLQLNGGCQGHQGLVPHRAVGLLGVESLRGGAGKEVGVQCHACRRRKGWY